MGKRSREKLLRREAQPEPPKEKVRRAQRIMYDQDKSYADGWMQEMLTWEKEGVYNAIAAEIKLKPGEIHMDLGAGCGNLALRIKQQNPEAHVIAIERNISLFRSARILAEQLNIRARIFHDEVIALYRDGSIGTEYGIQDVDIEKQRPDIVFGAVMKFRSLEGIAEDTDNGFLTIDDAIRIVVDDIRSLHLMRKILGERRIDSASMTFPGTGGRAAYEFPYHLPKPNTKLNRAVGIRRISDEALKTTSAAISEMSELMMPGAQFFLAERFLKLYEGDVEKTVEHLGSNLMSRFGHNLRYWDAPLFGIVKKYFAKPVGLSWTRSVAGRGSREFSDMNDGETVGICFMKIRRNETPFSP